MRRSILLGLGGFIAGVLIGFAIAFFVGVASVGRSNEMRGVAGIDFGILYGVPFGGLVGAASAVWLGRRVSETIRPAATDSINRIRRHRRELSSIEETTVESLIVKLLEHWREVGVTPAPGACESELLAFENQNGVRLPSDLRQFLQVANGMAFSELDGLARLRPVGEYFRIIDRAPHPLANSESLPDLEKYFCFGDYNIEAIFWGIRLSEDPVASCPVRVFWTHGLGRPLAGSFREFLVRYLTESPDAMC